MKSTLTIVFCAALAVAAVLRGPNAAAQAEALPLIVIDEVPPVDAIRNLARQANLKIVIDPRVPANPPQPFITYEEWLAGKAAQLPAYPANVSMRVTNMTAHAALIQLLNGQHLAMVTNPATSVTRIAPMSAGAKPVSASQVGPDTKGVVPLLVMDFVPVPDAISNLASAAQIKAPLDPKWREYALSLRLQFSCRWEKITPKQALIALLDNFDLVLIEDAAASSSRITVRTQPRGGSVQKPDPERKQP